MALEDVLARVGLNPADFTQGELVAIEHAVSGGATVAQAVQTCAPTKSRSDSFSGGNYQWSRNSDGTFNLFDVPVFAKHVRKLGMKLVLGKDGEPKVEENVINVDEKWLNRAVEINRERRESGKYLGALHVRHHGSGADQTEPAGKFVLKYVRPMMYDGEMVPVLYPDFVQIPAAIFDRIKAGLLPYRSIESLPPKFEEIDSIALLDTETPWFRLPMLTPGQEIQREVYAATCAPVGSPLRGVAVSSGKQLAALCYFAGGSYSEKPEAKKDDKKKPAPGGDDETDREEREFGDGEEGGEETLNGSKNGPIQCDVCGMTHPNDGRHEDDSADLAGEGEEGETMGKILEALTGLLKGQEELLKRFAAPAPTPVAEGAPVSETGAKPSTMQSKASDAEKLEGRLAATEQMALDLKRAGELKALVAKAITKDLCEYNLGTDAQDKLLAKAQASKEPEKVVEAYVEAVKEHGTKMPTPYSAPRSGMSGKGFVPPPAAELPESVRAYAAKGPEALEKALKARDMFLLCKEQGSVGSLSEVDFIKHRVEPGYGARIQG